MRRTLPLQGRSRADVIAEMRAIEGGRRRLAARPRAALRVQGDRRAERGRPRRVLEFFSRNALGGKRAFPSVKKMEDEVVEMALDLFHAPDGAQGFMSTGGTESIIQAVQTCRDWNRKRRGDPKHRGNLVLPESVHPAFNKAAKLMDLEVRRVPVGADFRADVAALDAAIDADTIMLVGSAPNFPYGGIDPIAELGLLARSATSGCTSTPASAATSRRSRSGSAARSRTSISRCRRSRRCRPTCTSSASARSRPRRCSTAMPTRRSTTTSTSTSGRTAAS
jgi:hypothetical protein